MKYESYKVSYYNKRHDGRVEPAGTETLVLTREEALEMSFAAVVVSRQGFVISEGKHVKFDPHLGWVG